MTTAEMINHPYLRKSIQPRLFQQTILNTCINKNTLVVLPTGSGKTIISILHIAYLLQRNQFNGEGQFILIMAPTKPLVQQHIHSFKQFLKVPPKKIIELSGAISPKIRKEMIKKALIVIATPQTIRNDFIHNYIQPENCILAYFDEAHRARGDYDYVHIADIIKRYNPQSRFIALTASPGTNEESILEICRNLFIEAIECRQKGDPEIREHIQDTDVERLEIPLPIEFEEILATINELGEKEINFLKSKNLTEKKFYSFYKSELLSLKQDLARNFRANYLEIMSCNRLIYIQILRDTLESQGIPSAYTLITNWREKNSKSIKGLLNLTEFREIIEKIESLNNKGIIHPKLLYLLEILDGINLINSKVLVFCNLRATAYAISKALAHRGINAKPFVGQGKGKQGLSQKKQTIILEAFRKDQFPVLVSTSVLEEGLDVDECNVVIFYDGTPSAIRNIQRSGRTGRKTKGRVIILTTHHTIDTIALHVSNAKEKRMNALLSNITWITRELNKTTEKETRAFSPKNKVETNSNHQTNKTETLEEKTEDKQLDEPIVSEEISPFKIALNDVKKWTEDSKKTALHQDEQEEKGEEDQVQIIVDSREKNSRILFHLKKEGINLDFKQLDCGDYILSDRVAVEYKKGEDLLSSIIDGRLFEQLGTLTNTYQIPILLIENFPTGGIHPEAIAGALASFIIDFGVSIIQTQNTEESATILKRIAYREQKTKKRKAFIRKNLVMSNPNESAIQVISSFPGVNRTLATRLLESFGTIQNIVYASIDDLKKIEGLGEKKSEKIIKISTQQFQ